MNDPNLTPTLTPHRLRKALSERVRTEVLLSGPCVYCADPIPTQVDHVIPWSRGGTDDWDNLAPACRRCNMEKLDFTPEEYRAYREEQGLGWPPQSGADLIRELAQAEADRRGVTLTEVLEVLARSLSRSSGLHS